MAQRTRPRPPRIDDALESPATGLDVAAESWTDLVLEGTAAGLDELPLEVPYLEVAGCRLTGVALTGRSFDHLRITDSVLTDCELSGLVVSELHLDRVRIERSRLSGLVAPGARVVDVTITGCRGDDLNLRMSSWEGSEVLDSVLPRADLYGARLTDVRLLGCDLSELDLTKATLREVALHRSELRGVKGGTALKGAVVAPEQVVALAYDLVAALGVRVEDEHEDEERR